MAYAKTVFFFCLVSRYNSSAVPEAVRARRQVSLSKDSEVPEAILHDPTGIRDEIILRHPVRRDYASLLSRVIRAFDRLDITEVDDEDIAQASVAIQGTDDGSTPVATVCHACNARHLSFDEVIADAAGRCGYRLTTLVRVAAPLHAALMWYLVDSVFTSDISLMSYRSDVVDHIVFAEFIILAMYLVRSEPVRAVLFDMGTIRRRFGDRPAIAICMLLFLIHGGVRDELAFQS